jgi:hypothetical protein
LQILTGPAIAGLTAPGAGPGASSFNHLCRIPSSQITFSPALSSLFGVAGLIDGNTEGPVGLFASIASPSTVTIDLDLLQHTGDFEGASIQAPWVVTLGTAVLDATFHNTGTQSVKLGASSTFTANVTVRAGEKLSIPYAISSDGVTTTARIRIQILETGYYLNSSLQWVNSAVDFDTQTGSKAFKTGTAVFTVQPYGYTGVVGTQSDAVTIQIQILNTTAGGNVWADSIFAWPSTSFGGIFGHNVPPATVVTMTSSTTGAFAGEQTLRGTFNGLKPTSWVGLSAGATNNPPWAPTPFSDRYVQLVLTSSLALPLAAPWFAEVVLGQLWTPLSFPMAGGISVDEEGMQKRNVTPSRKVFAAQLSGKLKTLTITFPLYGMFGGAQYPDIRDAWIERAQSGTYPTIILLPELDPDLCLWGRLQAKESLSIKMLSDRELKLTFEQEPIAMPGLSVTA